ncbi:MAG: penicillin-binding protein activator [Colwellia sp.]
MSQSNLTSSNKGTFSVAILVILSALFLASCTSTPKPDKTVTPVAEKNEPVAEVALTAQETLALATSEESEEARALLIQSASLFLQENNSIKALWLSDQLLSLQVSESQTYQLLLIKAQSLQNLQHSELALETLTKIHNTYATTSLTETFYRISESVYFSLDKDILALNANLYADNFLVEEFNSVTLVEDDQYISAIAQPEHTKILNASTLFWEKIQHLPSWQLDTLKKYNAPHSQGWLALLSQVEFNKPASMALQKSLTLWSTRYPKHPAQLLIPSLEQGIKITSQQLSHKPIVISDNIPGDTITTSTTQDMNSAEAKGTSLETTAVSSSSPVQDSASNPVADPAAVPKNITSKSFENIAVLIPLSGPQAIAGKTIQQGFLAAYHEHANKKVQFYDTMTLDWASLNERLIKDQIDFTVGPLLKSNINKFEQIEGNDLPALYLNIPTKDISRANQFAFSMLPEDEATQAAWQLSEKGFLYPIILSHDDPVSRRIAKAFSSTWMQRTGLEIDIHYFNQGKEMQDNLKSGFDVDASQARISQIGKLISYPVKSEKRNRRDVDMIYLVGTTAQTKLVKPFIDVNTSRFSKRIPVYASSRSHDGDDNDITNNDLNGLVFTESPWLVSNENQNKQLSELSETLFPNRSGSLSRIFAMGFDSYGLIDNIFSMSDAPYLRFLGQTGTLRLNDQIITRSFLWGKYQRNGVKAVKLH